MQSTLSKRRGFTLVELLVVMIIISMLIGLLIPAVQKAREAARRASCGNNLKQIQIAVTAYEAAHKVYPSSWKSTPAVVGSDNINGWSAQAILLPYIEQSTLYDKVDFQLDYTLAPNIVTADGAVTQLSAMRIPTYLCPSESKDEVRFSGGVPKHYPLNYAANLGVWFVFDPDTKRGGKGAFYPDSKLKAGDFKDWDVASWHLVHASVAARGVMLIAFAAIIHLPALPLSLLSTAAWLAIVFTWTSTAAMVTRALSGERGLRCEGSFPNRRVFILYGVGTIAIFPACAVLLVGLARSLTV